MKKPTQHVLAVLTLALLATACLPGVGSSSPASPDQVATVVALTFQALTPGSTAGQTPEPAGLLPHSLYYLGQDNSGLTQVFRIEKDGRTVKQVTSEPAGVQEYGVSPADGSVAYTIPNQLILIDADGSGRRILVDGDPVDENNPFLTRISKPVFSPDGDTIAYGHQGLNFYVLSSGTSSRAIENQMDDMGNGLVLPKELYWPEKYSPDGSKLLITLGYYEGSSAAFYDLGSKSLVRLQGDQDATICCDLTQWSADGMLVHSASPSMGMSRAGLWAVDPKTGSVATLLASDWDALQINHARSAYLAPDGQLYFFFFESNNPDLNRVPLQLVRSAPDGVSGRAVILDKTFETINEALWSPDASSVIVAYAPDENTYQGGRAEIVYLDGRPNVVLAPFAQQMKWGP